MSILKKKDPAIYNAIAAEKKRQHDNLELIASENFASEAVLEAQGSILTNKYAEGYPSKRWYGGCEYIDDIENIAIERAKKLFGAEHVNVQPHSGSQANMAVFFALLDIGDTFMAMDLACGGHLTHGLKTNFSGRYFNAVTYGVDPETEMLDYDKILEMAKTHRPKMILAGASAYPRTLDFKRFRKICDEVGAFLFVDMAHIAGLVVAGLHPNPVEVSEVVTTTTHKTLRGPRSGVILCKNEFAKKIDAQIFPGIQGGPLEHVIAAKAVAFKEAMAPEFKKYQKNVVENAKRLSWQLAEKGYRIVSGGTDTHLFLVDFSPMGLTGKDVAAALDKAGITVNKNMIPFDKNGPFITSGIRIGTPAVTTRGMCKREMDLIASYIGEVLKNINDLKRIAKVKKEVKKLMDSFPLYKDSNGCK